jgi:hypothetical protein
MSQRLSSLFLLFFFLYALVLNGVVLTKSLPGPGSGRCAIVIAFDVCGHAHHGAIFDGPDIIVPMPAGPSLLLSFDKGFPPIPDEAVASADPGETEKPPEA